MRRILLLAVSAALMPSTVLACPGCVSSAFGDRTYGWPYLSLLLAPFLIISAVAGVLAYHYRPRRPQSESSHGKETT